MVFYAIVMLRARLGSSGMESLVMVGGPRSLRVQVNMICTPKMVHPGAMVWVEIISIFDPNIISTQAPYVVRLLSDEEY